MFLVSGFAHPLYGFFGGFAWVSVYLEVFEIYQLRLFMCPCNGGSGLGGLGFSPLRVFVYTVPELLYTPTCKHAYIHTYIYIPIYIYIYMLPPLQHLPRSLFLYRLDDVTTPLRTKVLYCVVFLVYDDTTPFEPRRYHEVLSNVPCMLRH